MLSLPIPVSLLLAAQPKLMSPVLQVLHRVITGFLLDQASLKAGRRYFSGSTLSSRKGRNSATVGWIGKASRSTW